MSVNTNGFATLTQSMNGTITISDGSGTVIQNGTVSTNNIQANNLQVQNVVAPSASTASSVYNNNTGNVYIGSTAPSVRLGAFNFISNAIQYITTATTVNLFTLSTGIINLGQNLSITNGVVKMKGLNFQNGGLNSGNFIIQTGQATFQGTSYTITANNFAGPFTVLFTNTGTNNVAFAAGTAPIVIGSVSYAENTAECRAVLSITNITNTSFDCTFLNPTGVGTGASTTTKYYVYFIAVGLV